MAGEPQQGRGAHGQGGVQTVERVDTESAPPYKVLLHNDDYTTMDFVVDVLMRFFAHDETESIRIMLLVHTQGLGVAGVFPKEVAETKVAHVADYALDHEMPLRCSMEPT